MALFSIYPKGGDLRSGNDEDRVKIYRESPLRCIREAMHPTVLSELANAIFAKVETPVFAGISLHLLPRG